MIDYAQYKVPEIKAELKKRGLARTGKKADLVSRLITAVVKEAFHLFPKLPIELRQKIWRCALPRRRIVEIEVGPMPWGSISISKPSLSEALGFMLTCKDAYAVAASRYRPVPTPKWCQPREDVEDRSWGEKVNYHDDVFYLSNLPDAIEMLQNFHNRVDLKLVKTVALPIIEFEDCVDYGGFEELLKLSSLEEIILMIDSRSAPKVNNRPKSEVRLLLEMLSPPQLPSPPSRIPNYSSDANDWFWQPLSTGFSTVVTKVPEMKPLENVKLYFSYIRD